MPSILILLLLFFAADRLSRHRLYEPESDQHSLPFKITRLALFVIAGISSFLTVWHLVDEYWMLRSKERVLAFSFYWIFFPYLTAFLAILTKSLFRQRISLLYSLLCMAMIVKSAHSGSTEELDGSQFMHVVLMPMVFLFLFVFLWIHPVLKRSNLLKQSAKAPFDIANFPPPATAKPTSPYKRLAYILLFAPLLYFPFYTHDFALSTRGIDHTNYRYNHLMLVQELKVQTRHLASYYKTHQEHPYDPCGPAFSLYTYFQESNYFDLVNQYVEFEFAGLLERDDQAKKLTSKDLRYLNPAPEQLTDEEPVVLIATPPNITEKPRTILLSSDFVLYEIEHPGESPEILGMPIKELISQYETKLILKYKEPKTKGGEISASEFHRDFPEI